MEKERNAEGWSARQLIRNLKRKTDQDGSHGNYHPEAQHSVGSTQSSVGSSQSALGKSAAGQATASHATGQAAGQAAASHTTGQAAGQATASHATGKAAGKKTSGKKSKGGIIKGLISGTIISESLILKDIRYTALIASLAIIFIANKFNAEAVERQIIVLEQDVRDMRAESLSVSAELGSVSRQSEITVLVKERGLGLEELREPPYRIVVNE